MYLLPTMEEINKLRRAINPTAQIMDYLYSRPPAEGSMAEFFMESEDIELAMEDGAMPYFDEIEDDIINMRRDINGFKSFKSISTASIILLYCNNNYLFFYQYIF